MSKTTSECRVAVTLRLPPALAARLSDLAKQRGITQNEMMTAWLDRVSSDPLIELLILERRK